MNTTVKIAQRVKIAFLEDGVAGQVANDFAGAGCVAWGWGPAGRRLVASLLLVLVMALKIAGRRVACP
jgi:hypothetical protein